MLGANYGRGHEPVVYQLIPAKVSDRAWLEHLRQEVYQELFRATFGGWDETRHARQFDECWDRGHISIIEVGGERIGMIQMLDRTDAIEIGEIQIQPTHQNLGLGALVLMDTIKRAHMQGKKVSLSVGLKNERAYRLYERLGFREIKQTETHSYLSCEPQR